LRHSCSHPPGPTPIRLALYDLETDGLSATRKFVCGVAWYAPTGIAAVYGPADAARFAADLNCCQLIAGHNCKAFDNPLLERVARPITAQTFDLLAAIRSSLGTVDGWGLESIAAAMAPNEHRWLRAREPAEGNLAGVRGDLPGAIQHCVNDINLFRLILRSCIRGGGRLVNSHGDTCCIDVSPLRGIPI